MDNTDKVNELAEYIKQFSIEAKIVELWPQARRHEDPETMNEWNIGGLRLTVVAGEYVTLADDEARKSSEFANLY